MPIANDDVFETVIIDLHDDCVPHPLNPKIHPDEQMDDLDASLEKFGWLSVPIFNRRTRHLLDGHARRDRALAKGVRRIPVHPVDVDEETELEILAAFDRVGEKREYDLAKLKEVLGKVQAASGAMPIGWDAKSFNALLRKAGVEVDGGKSGLRPDADPDDMPDEETSDEPCRVQTGQVWKLGNHYLLCGDSTLLPHLEGLFRGKRAVMVATDPPYLMGFTASVHADGEKSANSEVGAIENEDLDGDLAEEFVRAYMVAIRTWCAGAFYIFHSRRHFSQLWTNALAAGLEPRYHLIWVKNNHTLSGSDHQSKYEGILYGGGKERKWNGGRDKMDVLEYDRPAKSDLHPTMKPADLVKRLVLNSSDPGDIVADFFSGSGTTIIVCEDTGRICYAVEKSPDFAARSIARWEQATGGTAVMAYTI